MKRATQWSEWTLGSAATGREASLFEMEDKSRFKFR